MKLKVQPKFADQPHITGPYYLENEAGDVVAEGLTKKNANLLAAAPDMLAALEFILSDKLEVYSPHGANLARAAITKAKDQQ